MTKNEKIKTLSILLKRYFDPKPKIEYKNFTSWQWAEMLVNAIEDDLRDKCVARLDRLEEKHLKKKTNE